MSNITDKQIATAAGFYIVSDDPAWQRASQIQENELATFGPNGDGNPEDVDTYPRTIEEVSSTYRENELDEFWTRVKWYLLNDGTARFNSTILETWGAEGLLHDAALLIIQSIRQSKQAAADFADDPGNNFPGSHTRLYDILRDGNPSTIVVEGVRGEERAKEECRKLNDQCVGVEVYFIRWHRQQGCPECGMGAEDGAGNAHVNGCPRS